MRREGAIVIAILILVSALGAGSAAAAEGRTLRPILLSLSVGSSSARLAIPIGGMARISIRDQQEIGLIPKGDSVETEISIVGLGIDPQTGLETKTWLGHVLLRLGSVEILEGLVETLRFELIQQPSNERPLEAAGPCTTCCVVCDEIRYCGCWVESNCGSCCCPAACVCPTSSFPSCVPEERAPKRK